MNLKEKINRNQDKILQDLQAVLNKYDLLTTKINRIEFTDQDEPCRDDCPLGTYPVLVVDPDTGKMECVCREE